MGLAAELADADLEEVHRRIRGCTRCPLHASRQRAVPGAGPPDASLFLLGEAPGREEDAQGRPFAGRGGGLLDAALRKAGTTRSAVFVTNAVKCRPPDNRRPRVAELRTCTPYHLRALELVAPRAVVTLGAVALKSLLGVKGPVKAHRNRPLSFRGVPVVATYHPAGVLRQRHTLGPRLVEDLKRAVAMASE